MTQPSTRPYAKCYHDISACYSDMSTPELRVTLALERELIGHVYRDELKASISDLQALTGMSRPSVATGIKAVIERGLFDRDDNSVWVVKNINQQVVKNINHQEPTSKKSLPPLVKNINQTSKKYLPATTSPKETLKKEYKDKCVSPPFPPY